MAYKITGTVLALSPVQTLSSKAGNSYIKRDLVITVRLFDPYTGQPEEKHGNTPKFTFIGERCRDLDRINISDVVTVHFDISGRSYEKDGRTEYTTDIRPFGVSICQQANQQQQSMAQVVEQTPFMAQPPAIEDKSEELPF